MIKSKTRSEAEFAMMALELLLTIPLWIRVEVYNYLLLWMSENDKLIVIEMKKRVKQKQDKYEQR